MEIHYDCYIKEIGTEKFYFVKQLLHFPELQIPKITQGYGMHQNFATACVIAGISNPEIQAVIFQKLEQSNAIAKLVNLSSPIIQLAKSKG